MGPIYYKYAIKINFIPGLFILFERHGNCLDFPEYLELSFYIETIHALPVLVGFCQWFFFWLLIDE